MDGMFDIAVSVSSTAVHAIEEEIGRVVFLGAEADEKLSLLHRYFAVKAFLSYLFPNPVPVYVDGVVMKMFSECLSGWEIRPYRGEREARIMVFGESDGKCGFRFPENGLSEESVCCCLNTEEDYQVPLLDRSFMENTVFIAQTLLASQAAHTERGGWFMYSKNTEIREKAAAFRQERRLVYSGITNRQCACDLYSEAGKDALIFALSRRLRMLENGKRKKRKKGF